MGWVERGISCVLVVPVVLSGLSWIADHLWGLVGWVSDLSANLSAQLAATGVVWGVWSAARRRWWGVTVSAVVVAVHVGLVAQGRAERISGQPGGGGSIRMLVFNAHDAEGDRTAALRLVQEVDADVVVLTEPNWPMLRAMRRDGELSGTYAWQARPPPGWWMREWTMVLSRWPMRQASWGQEGTEATGTIEVVVETPAGELTVVAGHPPSPRTIASWQRGNEIVVAMAEAARGAAAAGRHVVVAADLNATPSGWRSRALQRLAPVRRGKPMLLAAGTYPARWRWPVSLALDDVWLGPGVKLERWTTLSGGGSDHRPVLVELVLERASAEGGGGSDRERGGAGR